MSIIEAAFLKVPFQDALKLYNDEIVPRLTKKNKKIAISTAIILSLIYLVREKVLKPPKKLRHITYFSYFDLVKSLINKESNWDRSYRVHIPEIDKKDNKGLFLEVGPFGWQLIVSNPVDMKQVLMHPDIFPKTDLTEKYRGTLPGKFVIGPHLALLNGHRWKSQRKTASPAFRRSIPVKMFGNLTQEMFQVMETMEGDSINVSDLMERWALDALGRGGFGFNFNSITKKNNEWVNRYNTISEGLMDLKFFIFPTLDSDLLWMLPQRQKIHKELDIFLKMIDTIIQQKKEAIREGKANKEIDDNERTLLDLMMNSGEDGGDIMSDEELKSNVCMFFRAGHDSTAKALQFVIHYLAQNQDIQQKAREEVIAILGDQPADVLPTIEDTKKMKYLNQIIKESLRINPPVFSTIPRIAMEDTELSGTFIPKGTPVFVNIFDIQHSENIWENADKFDPERFSDSKEGSQPGSWIPFGDGPRQCIAMNFGLAEQRVLLSMLLRKFSWITPENSIHKVKVVTATGNIVGPANLDIKFVKRY